MGKLFEIFDFLCKMIALFYGFIFIIFLILLPPVLIYSTFFK